MRESMAWDPASLSALFICTRNLVLQSELKRKKINITNYCSYQIKVVIKKYRCFGECQSSPLPVSAYSGSTLSCMQPQEYLESYIWNLLFNIINNKFRNKDAGGAEVAILSVEQKDHSLWVAEWRSEYGVFKKIHGNNSTSIVLLQVWMRHMSQDKLVLPGQILCHSGMSAKKGNLINLC